MTSLLHTLALLAAGLAGAAACISPASAQPAPPAAVEDSMAQRMQACTACHGKEGRAARDGYYPRIAGKPAGYIYNQLANFRDGRRHYALMSELLVPLTDDYLHEIAGYFASLDLPYPAPKAPTAPTTVRRVSVSAATTGGSFTASTSHKTNVVASGLSPSLTLNVTEVEPTKSASMST